MTKEAMTREEIEKMRKEIAMYTDIPQHVDNILEVVEQAGGTLPSTANRETLADKLRAASRLKLEADSRLRKINWFQDKWLSFDKKDRYFILDQIFSLISPPMDEDDLVEDGFGSAAPAICPDCGCRAVYVCRPGDMRCGVCYDGNPKEWYTGSK